MSATALADPAKAKLAWDKGLVAYNLQRYDDALAMFTRAYEEKPDPAFLFNIGQCQRLLGKYAEASRSYRTYLLQAELTAQTREHVRKLIDEVDQAQRQRAAAHEARPVPEPAPLPAVAPVEHHAAAPTPYRWYRDPVGMSLLGVGVGVGVVGIGLGALGNHYDSEIPSAPSLSRVQMLEGDRDTFRTAGWALVGVGGAAVLTGAVVLTVRSMRHHSEVRAAGNGGAMAVVW